MYFTITLQFQQQQYSLGRTGSYWRYEEGQIWRLVLQQIAEEVRSPGNEWD